MPVEPAEKRVSVYLDGQNLFYAAKEAFGYNYPNYDPVALASAVCKKMGWSTPIVYFYTGIPSPDDNPFWHHFWTAKMARMGTRGVRVFSRPLKYRNKTIHLPDGSVTTVLVGQEKGIDVRIALDVIRDAWHDSSDIALVFSQDQDLSEVASEIRSIIRRQGRWLKMACAYPLSPTSRNRRGINGCDWIPIDRTIYDACLDPTDYRPK